MPLMAGLARKGQAEISAHGDTPSSRGEGAQHIDSARATSLGEQRRGPASPSFLLSRTARPWRPRRCRPWLPRAARGRGSVGRVARASDASARPRGERVEVLLAQAGDLRRVPMDEPSRHGVEEENQVKGHDQRPGLLLHQVIEIDLRFTAGARHGQPQEHDQDWGASRSHGGTRDQRDTRLPMERRGLPALPTDRAGPAVPTKDIAIVALSLKRALWCGEAGGSAGGGACRMACSKAWR